MTAEAAALAQRDFSSTLADALHDVAALQVGGTAVAFTQNCQTQFRPTRLALTRLSWPRSAPVVTVGATRWAHSSVLPS